MKKMRLCILLTPMLFWLCDNPSLQFIMTVNGQLADSDMGITLAHEHLLVDFIGADSTGYDRWDKAAVVDKVLPYLLEVKEYGVKTFIDCTPAFLGRDPILLQMLSEQSGMQILTTTGFYGAYQNKFVPKFAFDKTAKELADLWTSEFENGIEGTDVRPGIIKISVERDQTLSEMHRKLIRAAAITHLQTGLTIVSHTGPESPAYEQIEVLRELGVAPNAFVWTHAQEGSREAHVDLARRGVWISLDKMDDRPETVQQMVDFLVNLQQENLLHKVLISHDAGWYKPEQPDGGDFRGFASIFMHLLPALKQHGFTDADIDVLLIENPQKAFAIRVRRIDS